MGNITIQGDLTGDVPGGEVGGASNLTTVGAIPYVSAAGVLNQDPTALFWDAANNRLGVGTASPNTQVELFTSGSNASIIRAGNSNGASQFGANATGATVVRNESAAQLISFQLSAEVARFAATTGNLLIGTTTDSNFKLDVAASGSAGTARFYGGAGVSDATKVVVRAGAGQSGNLQEWQAANGAVRASVGSVGDFIGSSYDNGGTWEAGSSLNRISNTYRVAWSSTGSYAGAADLSLSRASAGVLQVGDGGSNANGVVSLTRSQHAGVLVAALPAAAAGNAGSIQYVTDANATTIGSTVAGGGANKVMVWSDGAAWKIFAS